MFIIFRIIKKFIVYTGYLLLILVLYFGFFPLEVKAKENLSLSTLFNCDEYLVMRDQVIEGYEINLSNFTEKNPEIKRNDQLENISLSALSSFNEGYNTVINSSAKLTYTLCETDLSDSEYIDSLNSFFSDQRNLYHYGVPSVLKEQLDKSMIDSIGILSENNPISQLLNIKIDLPTLVLSKTSFCQTPLQSSRYYIIAKDGDLIYLFFVHFVDDDSQPLYIKVLKNLSSSVQTMKSNLNCVE